MDIEGIMLREISQKDKYVWFHLYVESKKWTNITKQKKSLRYREPLVGKGKEGWGGGQETNRWGRLRRINSSCKINESRVWNAQYGKYSQ